MAASRSPCMKQRAPEAATFPVSRSGRLEERGGGMDASGQFWTARRGLGV